MAWYDGAGAGGDSVTHLQPSGPDLEQSKSGRFGFIGLCAGQRLSDAHTLARAMPAPDPSAWGGRHSIAPLRQLVSAGGRESVCRGLRPLHGACRSHRGMHRLYGRPSVVRQCKHTRSRRPSRPSMPCRQRCGPAAALHAP